MLLPLHSLVFVHFVNIEMNHEEKLKSTKIYVQVIRLRHSIGATRQCYMAALSLCSLLAANSQISVLIGQKMQSTGCDYGNDTRNSICVEQNF